MVQAAFNAVDVELAVNYQPMARSVQSFGEGRFVAHVGSRNVLFVSVPKDQIDSMLLGNYSIFFHYLKSRQPGPAPSYDKLSDLKDYRIASLVGTPTIKILKKAHLKVDSGPNLDSGLMKLMKGRVDLWASVGSTAIYLAERNYPERAGDLAHIEKPIFAGSIDMNFRKDHEEYPLRKQQFSKGMDIIYANGTYMDILESYFGKGLVPAYILSDDYKQRFADTASQ